MPSSACGGRGASWDARPGSGPSRVAGSAPAPSLCYDRYAEATTDAALASSDRSTAPAKLTATGTGIGPAPASGTAASLTLLGGAAEGHRPKRIDMYSYAT